MPAVIAENDESKWADETGALYHFPKQYRGILSEGTAVLYYKGKMRNKAFVNQRLSEDPHYFGVARIGKVYDDKNSTKGDLFAVIQDFTPFEAAVPIKIDGQYLEPIPPSLKDNYWRNGVRSIDQAALDGILARAVLKPIEIDESSPADEMQDFETKTIGSEGKKITYFGVKYERCPRLRLQAIRIHGLSCNACGFDFEKVYGEHGKGKRPPNTPCVIKRAPTCVATTR